MPNLDGTGPERQGPRTGRGQGRCNPNTQNDQVESFRGMRGFGRGLGRGLRGLGRAFRWGRRQRGRKR